MLADVLSAVLRGLSFIALAQAAGAVLFLLRFEKSLDGSRESIRSTAGWALACGLVLVPIQFSLEAARMAGSLSGVYNWDLQAIALSTPGAKVVSVRMVALGLLWASLRVAGSLRHALAWAGVVLVCASFALMGHTTTNAARWLLGPVVVLHVLIVAFWFGSLRPLMHMAQRENVAVTARVVQQFSALAVLAVPLILVAGLVLAWRLLPGWQALGSHYGLAIAGKVAAFAVLIALAVRNKFRLGPALAEGGPSARRLFTAALMTEWVLIAVVLMGTAALTTFLSPVELSVTS